MADATNLDLLINDFNSYLVTPANAFGLGGFLFDVEGETRAELTAEITDHYLEDNTAIQDHIAIRPKKFTLKGYVGELVFSPDGNPASFLQTAVQKLTELSPVLPVLSQAAQQAKQFYASGSISTLGLGNVSQAADYWATVKNLGAGSSKQQAAYQYFKALWEQKILVSVQTPFEFVANMAIESIIGIQSESSKFICDFSIVLKQIRTVSELSVTQAQQFGPPAPGTTSQPIGPVQNSYSISPADLQTQGRASEQIQPLQQGGSMAGSALPIDTVGVTPQVFGPLTSPPDYNSFVGGTAPDFIYDPVVPKI